MQTKHTFIMNKHVKIKTKNNDQPALQQAFFMSDRRRRRRRRVYELFTSHHDI